MDLIKKLPLSGIGMGRKFHVVDQQLQKWNAAIEIICYVTYTIDMVEAMMIFNLIQ